MAVEMGCDTLFVLTDDPPYLKEGDRDTGVEITDHPDQIMDFTRGIERRLGRQVKFNTICYKPHSKMRRARDRVLPQTRPDHRRALQADQGE